MTPMFGIIASQISGRLSTAAYDSIATVTLSSTAATVTFSSIPSTYKHLEIRSIGRIGSANYGPGEFYMRFNSDTNYSNYYGHYFQAGGPTPSTGSGPAPAGSNATGLQIGMGTGGSASASLLGAGVTTILDYANTNKYKTSANLAGADFNGAPGGTGGYITFDSGVWMSTAAITRIDIQSFGATAFQAPTQFALYGIKG